MLGQRRRRLENIIQTSDERLVFAVMVATVKYL